MRVGVASWQTDSGEPLLCRSPYLWIYPWLCNGRESRIWWIRNSEKGEVSRTVMPITGRALKHTDQRTLVEEQSTMLFEQNENGRHEAIPVMRE